MLKLPENSNVQEGTKKKKMLKLYYEQVVKLPGNTKLTTTEEIKIMG